MNETDDRLAGDPVWELFPGRATGLERQSPPVRFGLWAAAACAVAACVVFSPPLAVVIACAAMAAGDFRRGRQLARSIPDKSGGTICALFTYAWGAWKTGLTAFAFVFLTAFLGRSEHEMPAGLGVALLLFAGGFLISAILTTMGLVRAFRSGMRVWVGAGVNQARTLLLGTLIVGFVGTVLGPIGVWLAVGVPHAGESEGMLALTLGATFGAMFVGPIVLLLILDWVCDRVVADCPGKFGPKVPTVGKWNA